MKVNFVVYDNTGRILRCGQATERQVPLQAKPGEHLLVAQADFELHYVNVATKKVMPKQAMPLKVSGTTISVIPAGTEVLVDGDHFTVDDGVLELEFDFPGTYTVTLDAPRFVRTTVEVTQA